MPWYDDAVFTNPVAGTVICDTGALVCSPLSYINYSVNVLVWSSVGIETTLQRRNAANDGNVQTQILPVITGRQANVPFQLVVNNGERLRIITNADFTGQVQASIFADRDRLR